MCLLPPWIDSLSHATFPLFRVVAAEVLSKAFLSVSTTSTYEPAACIATGHSGALLYRLGSRILN